MKKVFKSNKFRCSNHILLYLERIPFCYLWTNHRCHDLIKPLQALVM